MKLIQINLDKTYDSIRCPIQYLERVVDHIETARAAHINAAPHLLPTKFYFVKNSASVAAHDKNDMWEETVHEQDLFDSRTRELEWQQQNNDNHDHYNNNVYNKSQRNDELGGSSDCESGSHTPQHQRNGNTDTYTSHNNNDVDYCEDDYERDSVYNDAQSPRPRKNRDSLRANDPSPEFEPNYGETRCLVCGMPGHAPEQCLSGTNGGSLCFHVLPLIEYPETRTKTSRMYGALSRLDHTSYVSFLTRCNTLFPEPLSSFLFHIRSTRPQEGHWDLMEPQTKWENI